MFKGEIEKITLIHSFNFSFIFHKLHKKSQKQSLTLTVWNRIFQFFNRCFNVNNIF